jgi:hypothetical protein
VPTRNIYSSEISVASWPIDEKVTRRVPDIRRVSVRSGGKLSRVTWNFSTCAGSGRIQRKTKIPPFCRFCRIVHRCSSHIAARNALMMRMVGPVRDSDQPTARPSSKKGNPTIFRSRLIFLPSVRLIFDAERRVFRPAEFFAL